MRSPARLLVWPVGLGVAVLIGGVLAPFPATTYGGASPELLWLQGTAVVALLVMASLTDDRLRYTALSLAASTWLLPELAGWAAGGGEAVRTAADAWSRALPAVVLLGVIPRPLRSGLAQLFARAAVVGCSVATLARLVLVDPFLQVDCWRTCARNPLLIGDGRIGAWMEAAAVLGGAIGVLGAALVQGMVATRRSSPRLVLGAGVAGVLLLGLASAAVLRLLAAESTASPAYLVVFLLVQTAVVGLALVEAGDRIAQWRLSDRLSRLAGALTAAPPPGSLAAALRETVHDPDLQVLYRSPGREALVDADGRDVDLVANSAGRHTTAVGRRGQQVALVVHSTHVDGERLDRALGPALSLVLENEQLRAAALAELAELRRSRERIVERSGLERRRLERNLHDGAQQRAVSLALMVRMLATRLPGDPAVDRAQRLTRSTVEELRRIARGIYPAVLADAGLTGALHELAESSTDLAVRVEGVPDGATRVRWRRPPTSSSPRRWSMRVVAGRQRRPCAATGGVPPSCWRCARRSCVRRFVDRSRGRPGRCAGRERRGHPARTRHTGPVGAPMRVVIADDAVLIRSGVAALLAEAGANVVGTAEDGEQLLRLVRDVVPDAVVVDIRMPPSHTDEGIQAAHRIRREHPGVSVLVLSQYLDSSYALRLVEENPDRVGYLLKDRIAHGSTLVDALERIAAGECVVDPTIVRRLLDRARRHTALDDLTSREREVLAHMAEGRSNRAMCELLTVSTKTVETHVSRIFAKLGLLDEPDGHRRVLAVLAYLRQGAP